MDTRQHVNPESGSPRVVLVYQLGKSEPQISGEPFPRLSDFRAWIRSLAEMQEFPALDFPMLGPVLREIRGRFPKDPIDLYLIATDQTAASDQEATRSDTIGVPELVQRWLAKEENLQLFGEIRLADPIIIERNPARDDLMAECYGKQIAPRMLPVFQRVNQHGPGRLFLCVQAGTPAMRYGAVMTFGRDARLIFLEKLHTAESVNEVSKYLALIQHRSLELIDLALANFDLTLAHRMLTDVESGFDPAASAVVQACNRLVVLRDWQAELFPEAARYARKRQMQESPAAWLVDQLSKEPGKDEAAEWPLFWQAKLVDIATRLLIARGRDDIPGFIDRLKHFRDIALLYGLTRYQLARDFRASGIRLDNQEQRQVLKDRFGREYTGRSSPDEPGLMLALVWRILNLPDSGDQEDRSRRWLNALLLLRFVTSERWGGLQQYRNQHIHNALVFERNLLDEFITKKFPNPRQAYTATTPGSDLLLGLVISVEQLMPDDIRFGSETILRECLTIAADLAAAHQLEIPTAATTKLKLLTERNPDALERFTRAVSARYENGMPHQQLIRDLNNFANEYQKLKQPAGILRRRILGCKSAKGYPGDNEAILAQNLVQDNQQQARLIEQTKLQMLEMALEEQWTPEIEALATSWVRGATPEQARQHLGQLLGRLDIEDQTPDDQTPSKEAPF